MHSKHFELVKGYYDEGLWPLDWVWIAVGKLITEDEYYEITGCKYPSKEKVITDAN